MTLLVLSVERSLATLREMKANWSALLLLTGCGARSELVANHRVEDAAVSYADASADIRPDPTVSLPVRNCVEGISPYCSIDLLFLDFLQTELRLNRSGNPEFELSFIYPEENEATPTPRTVVIPLRQSGPGLWQLAGPTRIEWIWTRVPRISSRRWRESFEFESASVWTEGGGVWMSARGMWQYNDNPIVEGACFRTVSLTGQGFRPNCR